MKLALLLSLALLTVGVVSIPTAVAGCPDPDNPCTPEPIDPVPDCYYGEPKITKNPVKWLICQL